MKKSTSPSKTSVSNVLREAQWDPRATGMRAPMAQMSASYLTDHAICLIQQSKTLQTGEPSGKLDTPEGQIVLDGMVRTMLLQAMGELALAVDKTDRE